MHRSGSFREAQQTEIPQRILQGDVRRRPQFWAELKTLGAPRIVRVAASGSSEASNEGASTIGGFDKTPGQRHEIFFRCRSVNRIFTLYQQLLHTIDFSPVPPVSLLRPASGPGTFAELGAFSISPLLRKKLMPILNAQ